MAGGLYAGDWQTLKASIEVEKAAMIKAHGKVAELFYEYDADDSGWLDEEEVLSFCGSL